MVLQTSGAISLLDIATEFGGDAPHSMDEYYGVDGVPGSGAISLLDFYGRSAYAAIAVIASGDTSYVHTSSGVASFGENRAGQLGNGSSDQSSDDVITHPNPLNITSVFGGKTVTQLRAGPKRVFALCSDNTLLAWGSNDYGCLASTVNASQYGLIANPTPPIDITSAFGAKTIVKVAPGAYHTLFLANDASVFACGVNRYGQLGSATNSGTYNINATPIDITNRFGGKTIVDVACGAEHSTAIASDSSVFSFGYNYYGQLATSTNSGTGNANPTPINITSAFPGKTIVQVAPSNQKTHFLASDGSVFEAGWYVYGGGPRDMTSAFGGKTITKLVSDAFSYHFAAFASDNSIFLFGVNDFGQTTLIPTEGADVPDPPTDVTSKFGGKTIVDVSVGSYHTLFRASDNTYFSVGLNNYGQLGTTTNSGTYNVNYTPFNITSSIQAIGI